MKEIDQLRGFLVTVLDYLELLKSEDARRPFVEGRSVTGFRQAVNDVIEMQEDLEPWQIHEIDKRLSEIGLPTLSAMSEKKFRTLLSIIGRGRIRSDSEYYIVNSYISDADQSKISPSEKQRAEQLLFDYAGVE